MARLLIVDDDQRFLDVVSKLLAGRNYDVFTTDNGEAALRWLDEQPADLLICDLNMSPISGTVVLKAAHEKHPRLAVIILTAYATVDTAIECLRTGAFDYMTKPFKIQEFVETIERALAWDPTRTAEDEVPAVDCYLPGIVAVSASMRDACTMIERVAPSDATVLFYGEPGVGKQHAGRAIHALSPRHAGPFVVADCAGQPPADLARTFFGTDNSAIPGEGGAPNGLFAQASGGTIWLSDVAALPLSIQERILRVFKEQLILPEGAKNPIPVNVRVLAETATSMERAVSQGQFRGDLFARFAPIAIEIKPLRERREDIIPLLWHCLREKLGPDIALPRVDPDARGLLLHYNWPGNVREVDSVAAHIMKDGPPVRITGKHLPESIIRSLSVLPTPAAAGGDASGRARALKAYLSRETRAAAATAASARQAAKPGGKK